MFEKLVDWWMGLKLIWKLLIIGGLIGIVYLVFEFSDNSFAAMWIIIVGGSGIIAGFFGLDMLINPDDYKNTGSSSSSSSGSYGSYSGGSSYSSGSSSGAESGSTVTESDLADAIKDTVHSKGISYIAIYYSPFVNQWYSVDYWGARGYVSYVRTGYGTTDYFETRDGKRFAVSGIPDKEQIYYYDTSK